MVMRARWRSFELPTRVEVEKETLTSEYGRFVAEPFERGFGITVGNSLRRVLLSSLEGAAVTNIKIEGAQHEFQSLPGVMEDVTDIVLNIKGLLIRMRTDGPRRIRVDVKRKGAVTGADVMADPLVEIINKDHVICTLSEDVSFRMEMEVRRGRGYVTAEENDSEDREIGVIPIDSIYSPVRRVRYRTENTRIGQLTDYDKLILEIWTNGTVSPEHALTEAGKILRKHLIPFVNYFTIGAELEPEPVAVEEGAEAEGELGDDAEPGAEDEAVAKSVLQDTLATAVSELGLSVRARNSLETAGVSVVAELVTKSEEELLKIRNFGKTSVKEIMKKLEGLGLSLAGSGAT